ncbi:exodeoxyribonuclease VII large subunit [Pseudohongiella spirulinae]|uniref:Exodeoxyribonuclease 7 large subunit n=1 Tax=Pseudohongiella spirulinae TaxID=1249552 RepID=A0A0S2KC58_9GAMM|nr:exodeoxyribonuclease VII large subunit [Pseudohongiella spirulinae]ALO45885.1 Exodeoxyribonuclease 7 large subunit [Pseudohongiella spirulinae]
MIKPSATPSPEQSVLSVSTLNRLARSLLEDCFPAVTVEGEISNLAMPGSGHWYLTLKDEQAQIRCAMFRNRNATVRLRPTNGMQVLVKGKLSLYEGRGDYQLILESMQDAGAGALQRAFEALKQKLADEGLFDPQGKQALPRKTRHIAVITSPAGAVLHDIISVLSRRDPTLKVTVIPVPVQGADSPDAITKALQSANALRDRLAIDVVLLARGGGSLEDLQAFNSETVARAIAISSLPVVSAVGHETDVSIADFVADVRAPTPSAAAELLSADQSILLRQLEQFSQRLLRQMTALLNQRQQQLDWLRRRLQHPGRRLQDQSQQLGQLEQRLIRAVRRMIEQRQLKLQMLARNLDNISPLQTLQRGYSITRNEPNGVLTSVTQASEGDTILTRLSDGEIVSTVTQVIRGGTHE